MLIEIKKIEGQGISKRELAELIGVNHNSIQTWRQMYLTGGISELCSHKKTGFKPSVFDKEEHNAIKEKLHDPVNGLRGYKELLAWIENDLSKEVKYNTLLKYCIRNFSSSVKVARKSHINKDPLAVEAFKKTSNESVKKLSMKRKKDSQK
jgi:transposase